VGLGNDDGFMVRYYHRSLNPSKLIDVGFSHLPPSMTIQRLSKLFKLPEEPLLPTFRLMRDNDCAQVHKLLNNYLQKYTVAPYFTKEDIRHYFLSREKIVYSYVTEVSGLMLMPLGS
jgi:glycylpeptide N-tetradecanoyltransferase